MTRSTAASAFAPRILRLALLAFVGLAVVPASRADDSDKLVFDIPAGEAGATLKQFAQQAKREIMFPAEPVSDVRTNAVQGQLTVGQALDQLLAGTQLRAIEDQKTGAFMVKREGERGDPPEAPARPPAAVAAGSDGPVLEQAIKLSPFEVQADSDKSYGAINSNSITRFQTELSKMPLSADIFTEAFIKDVRPFSLEDLITHYSAGAGINGADSGGSAASNQPGDRNGNYYITLRGLMTPVTERDSLMPVGAFGNPGSTGVDVTSLFDTERVEVIRGPQSLLYAGGGGGGVINTVSNQARFGANAGNINYQIDQYGSKQATFDYGYGTDNLAVRVDAVEQKVGNRRVNIGGTIHGGYAQIAAKVLNTTFRLTGEQTYFNRINNNNTTVTLPTGDPRSGDELTYLLATNKAGPVNPVTGAAFTGGTIDNGNLNWGNVNSFGGWQSEELVFNTWTTLVAQSQWIPGVLSTEISAGYDAYYSDKAGGGPTLLGPGASGNTLPGWSASQTPSDSLQPARTKSVRAVAYLTNDLFGGKAKSQTIFGADFLRTDFAQIAYSWYQADANFNPLINSTTASTGGRTALGTQLWSVDGGPVLYPLWGPRSARITVNGVNYIRMLSNPPTPSLMSITDPHGVVLGGSNYIITKLFNKGLFGMNSTAWMDGRLTTMAGFRYAFSDEDRLEQGNAAPLPPQTEKKAQTTPFDYSLGANYAINSWLHIYVEASNSYDPPPVEQVDPLGRPAQSAHAVGQEAGFKFANASNTISGSLAVYHVNSKNEEFLISSTLENDIDPQGLNGKAGGANQWVNLDRTSQGVELILTYAPNDNWRFRFSASEINGTTLNTRSYAQVYNDQFYTNSAGQVTYKDGTVVFVNPSATSSSTVASAVVPSTTPGAVPLTLALMNTSTSAYWANPASITGLISSSSLVGKILATPDPVHGPILTGATGLPISSIQVNPLSNAANIAPPGTVVLAQAGDASLGYPQYTFNFTGVYTATTGALKGLYGGTSLSAGWKYRDYYYYPTGVGPSSQRTLFFLPNYLNVDPIIGYTRKFGKFTWSTQLNITNLFNHYHVVFLPGPNTGWTSNGTGINATFDQPPRYFVWTNTVAF